MKFGKLLVLVLALGWVCCGAAQAQLSVYGLFQADRVSGMKCEDPAGDCSGAHSNASGDPGGPGYGANSHVNLTGGWGGITYDFRNVGPVRLGVDLRAGEEHSNKSGTNYGGGDNATGTQNVLVGLKGTFHTPIKILKPYAQVSVGWARTNAAEGTFVYKGTTLGTLGAGTDTSSHPRTYDSYVAYEGIIGLDIKIFPILDLRLPELSIGNMNMIGTAPTTATTTSLGVKSIGLGIVFHLPAS